MSKHTPGPWRVNYNCFGASGMNVEIINEVKAEEVMANAHLIAAAPDLLEACKSALALINISTDYAGMSTSRELEAAIKKAKGE